MKRLVVGAAVAGSAAFALRRLVTAERKLRDHCRDMIAGRRESKSASGCTAGAAT